MGLKRRKSMHKKVGFKSCKLKFLLRSAASLISTIMRRSAGAGCVGLFDMKASNPLQVLELKFYLRFIRQRGKISRNYTVSILSQKLNTALH